MEITLNKAKFIEALSIGGAFAGKSKILPILNTVKVKVSPNELVIVSSDQDHFISRKMLDGVDCAGESTFCINPTEVINYVKTIGSENVVLSVDDKNVEICHANGSMKVSFINGSDFPSAKVKSNDMNTVLNIRASILRCWIKEGMAYVGNDELRQVLKGIFIYKKDGKIGCCASNGGILFTDDMDDMSDSPDFKFILGSECFKPFLSAFNDDTDVEVHVNERMIMFKNEKTSMLSILCEGKYPNFKSIISSETGEIKATINLKELISALNRCQLAADTSSFTVCMEFDWNDKACTLTTTDIDFGKSASEYLEVEAQIFREPKFKIYFKISNLRSILDSIDSEMVELSMSKPDKPCFIREAPDPNNKVMLIMPMLGL